MSIVKLKRALLVDKVFYQPGVQDIPDDRLKHYHFVHYIKCGIVVPPDNEDVEKLETPAERAARLHKLELEQQAKKQELLKKVEAPAAAGDETAKDPEPAVGKKKSKKG